MPRAASTLPEAGEGTGGGPRPSKTLGRATRHRHLTHHSTLTTHHLFSSQLLAAAPGNAEASQATRKLVRKSAASPCYNVRGPPHSRDLPVSTDPVGEYAEGLVHLEFGRTFLAVQDFFNVVDSRDASPDLKARARLARGRTALLAGAELTAISEWAVILELPGVSPEIAAEAWQELCRLAGVTAAPDDLDLRALFDQCRSGWAAGQQGAAMAALELVLHHPRTDICLRARAIGQRGAVCLQAGLDDLAAADWNSILHAPDADDETRQLAGQGLERIDLRRKLRSAEQQLKGRSISDAISEFEAVLRSPGGNGFEQCVAANYLLKLPGVPEDVRCCAEELVDRLREEFLGLPASLVVIPAECVPGHRNVLAAGLDVLPKPVQAYLEGLLLSAAAGAIFLGGLFLSLVALTLLTDVSRWAEGVVIVLIAAAAGMVIGGGLYLISSCRVLDRQPGTSLGHFQRAVIGALCGASIGVFLTTLAWLFAPHGYAHHDSPIQVIAIFALVLGIAGAITESI